MSMLFNNKYRIPSARLQNWNYANEGMYFVTICTKNRENFFGEIMGGDGGGNAVGNTAVGNAVGNTAVGNAGGRDAMHCVSTPPPPPSPTPTQPPIPPPVLQPTEIGQIAHSEWYKTIELRPDMNLELGEFVVMPNHIHGIVMIGANEYNTPRIVGMNTDGDGRDAMHCVPTPNQFGPQSKNLASIIRGYKSAVTTYARKNNIAFDWQTRFHDHIIRAMDDYYRISNYIMNNPAKWQDDKFYKG